MQHLSKQYDTELDDIRNRLLAMSALACSQLERVHRALDTGALFTPDEVAQTEREINSAHVEIDALCAMIIVKRQPAADDLRHVLASMHAINDIERIGDEAKRALAKLGAAPAIATQTQVELASMGAMVVRMLQAAMESLRRLHVVQAYDVIRADARLDAQYGVVMDGLAAITPQSQSEVRALLDSAAIAKALERCGDHTKNVAEAVIAMVRGEDVRHQPLSTT
jgi:phosphate transport system protein